MLKPVIVTHDRVPSPIGLKAQDLNLTLHIAQRSLRKFLCGDVFNGVFWIYREQTCRSQNASSLFIEPASVTRHEVVQHVIEQNDIYGMAGNIHADLARRSYRSDVRQSVFLSLLDQLVQRALVLVQCINRPRMTDDECRGNAVVSNATAEIHDPIAWLDTDIVQEADAVLTFPSSHWIDHRWLHGRGPKMAVPTLIILAPSSMATW